VTHLPAAPEPRGPAAPLGVLLTSPQLQAQLFWNRPEPEPPTLIVAAPFDPASSFHNVVLAWAQRPTATQLAGAGTWRRLGRHVRAGERGILLLIPGVPSEALLAAAGTLPGAIPALAFDIAQTDPDRTAGAAVALSLTALIERRGALALAGQRIMTRRSPTPGRATQTLAHDLAHLDLAAARAAAADDGPPATAVAVVASDPNGLRADVCVLPVPPPAQPPADPPPCPVTTPGSSSRRPRR
jgi:hypothetical protein